MIYGIIIVVLLGFIGVALLILVMMWLVKSRYRGTNVPAKASIEALGATESKRGTCSRCGEQRIIVSDSEGMCASCYSALRTKAQ
jgi:hypothetical protein